MSLEFALNLAHEAMNNAWSTEGDTLMTLGQARARMDVETVLPSAPVRLLEEVCKASSEDFKDGTIVYVSILVRICR